MQTIEHEIFTIGITEHISQIIPSIYECGGIHSLDGYYAMNIYDPFAKVTTIRIYPHNRHIHIATNETTAIINLNDPDSLTKIRAKLYELWNTPCPQPTNADSN